jgi:glycerol-3-phosphate O-acyltransferase
VTITPVGLVAAALLSHVRRGIGAAEVARRVELLRYVAAESGARFARDLAGATSDPRAPGPIAAAVRRLAADGLVATAEAAGETIYQVPDEKRPLLDYHRNAVLHRYAALALVSASVRAAGDAGEAAAVVRERALFLSRLLKLEFIYRVGARFDEIFEENAAFLERVGAIAREGDLLRPGRQGWTLTFLAELLRAYLEAYRLAAETALAATSGRAGAPLDRRALVRETLERGRAAFLSGGIALRESLSKATLENAAEWLVAQGMLAEEQGKISLRDDAALREVVDRIAPLLSA